MKKNRRVSGFTLTELIVVLAIIGILAGLLVPNMMTYYAKSRVRTANANAKLVYNAAQAEVQKYVSADRVFDSADDKSGFAGVVLLSYDPSNGIRYSFVAENPVVAVTDLQEDSAQRQALEKVVENVNKTVASGDELCWAVYVDGYMVKSSVAAQNTGTDYIGYFTSGRVTTDRASGSYSNVYLTMLREKKAVYDSSISAEPETT